VHTKYDHSGSLLPQRTKDGERFPIYLINTGLQLNGTAIVRYQKQFEINGLKWVSEAREEEKKKLLRSRQGIIGIMGTGDANELSLFQWTALLDGLMPLKGVLAGKGLST